MSGDEQQDMSKKEMQEYFEKMVSDHALDIETRICGAMDKIDGFEGTVNAKFDDVNTTVGFVGSDGPMFFHGVES